MQRIRFDVFEIEGQCRKCGAETKLNDDRLCKKCEKEDQINVEVQFELDSE